MCKNQAVKELFIHLYQFRVKECINRWHQMLSVAFIFIGGTLVNKCVTFQKGKVFRKKVNSASVFTKTIGATQLNKNNHLCKYF
jgi:hypothetical protein